MKINTGKGYNCNKERRKTRKKGKEVVTVAVLADGGTGKECFTQGVTKR
jgi:hypothetical protein